MLEVEESQEGEGAEKGDGEALRGYCAGYIVLFSLLGLFLHSLALSASVCFLRFIFNPSADGWEEASISDGDEDGEWVDVHHSSDEETSTIVRMLCLYGRWCLGVVWLSQHTGSMYSFQTGRITIKYFVNPEMWRQYRTVKSFKGEILYHQV